LTRRRARRLLLPLAACALAPTTTAARAVATPVDPAPLLLRLPDLGPGYVREGDPGGLVLAGEGAAPALTQIYLDHRHTGYADDFVELWAPSDGGSRADSVTSAAFRFRDTAGPMEELQHAPDVIAYVTGLSKASLQPLVTPAIGDESIAFRTDDALVSGHPRRPGAVVLWRSGQILALLLTADPSADVAAEATRLASVQQQRIATPTPLTPADTDDIEVPLDNPKLGIDVHWLGRRFQPPGPLPGLVLTDAQGPLGRGEGPGERVFIDYGTRPWGSDVRLSLWRPRAWRRNAHTRFGRIVWGERSVRTEKLSVPGGRAIIYAN
jgi:hypothetical protein